MSGFERDEEMPAGFSDADLEQASLEQLGRRLAALWRRGICTHGWWQTAADGRVTCLHCAKVFGSEAEHLTALETALRGGA